MHLVYNAIRPEKNNDANHTNENAGERLLRYMAYLEACEKYRHQIAAIRKYFPGWAPEFC
ncbi:MAG TPA: hypothetical protein VFE53_07230 [Mucilaginibacter sp.]|jgi:hypothetical protein|nr:hypothetical protein [Mucilaginibacter sp.]